MDLPHSSNPLEYPARFQWGQPNVSRALAQTACTDTCVQMIVEYWKEVTYSLNTIRSVSGKGVDGIHGLTIAETLKALNALGVDFYKVATGVDYNFVIQKSSQGSPVLFGVGYNEYPAKKGVWCDQSNLAVRGGKVDCNFQGPHAELCLGMSGTNAVIRDPDHWEASRLDYELLTKAQLNRTMRAIVGNMGWNNTFALYTDNVKKTSPLPVPSDSGVDVMYNVGPSTTLRDARLKAGTVLYSDSSLKTRYSSVASQTDLGFAGSGSTFIAVVNGGYINFVSKDDVVTTTIVNTRNYT